MAHSPIVVSAESKILAWLALRDESVKKQLKQLQTDGFDWESLISLARRHRMVSLLYHAIENNWIGRPPDTLLSTISDEVRVLYLQASNQSYDQTRLLASFQSENISVIVLKGTPLSYRLYGNFALRQSIDIDLLIHPADKKKAISLLYKQGYRPLDLHRSEAGEWYLEHVESQMELIHPVRGTNIELSWRLHQQTDEPSEELFYDTSEEAREPKYHLSPYTEAKDLLAHGAMHGWERLKWLTDLWRVWECYDVKWDDWQVEMEQSGLKAALHSALLLHEWMIPEHPLPEHLKIKGKGSLRGKIIARWAIRQISGNPMSPDIENRNVIQNLHASAVRKISLRPSYHLKKIRSGYINRKDVDAVSFPRWAFRFYPVLKPVTWIVRLIKNIRPSRLRDQKTVTLQADGDLDHRYQLEGGDFRLFGMKVSSEMNLPLDRCDSNESPDVTIRITDQLPDQENGMDWLAEIPATGSILLKGNHSIYIKPAPAVHPGNLRLWLLGSTLGALCWRRGWIPLHATSVRFKERVVMISGPSGVGKSTLAAACLAEGAELYTDDISPVYVNESGKPELPGSGLRRLKLWPDAAERFAAGFSTRDVIEEGVRKIEIEVPAAKDEPAEAGILLCMNDNASIPEVKELKDTEALKAISENLFWASYAPEEARERVLLAGITLSQHLTIYEVRRPEGLEGVARLADKIASGWPITD